jgi:hypothetical protein
MRKKSFNPVLVIVCVLLVCNLSIFAQVSQTPPASQSVSGAGAPSNNISEQDIEMLRADLRAQRKQIGKPSNPMTNAGR